MGGADSGEWHLHPEHCAILIGTQDMLLSRVMNRGYAAPRGRWPMKFGLINQDCLWVMDEIQLMDVGLATSAQLQAFLDEDVDAQKSLRPCFTWWMSTTLQKDWLEKSPDISGLVSDLRSIRIDSKDRTGRLWDDVSKPCNFIPVNTPKALAELVGEKHCDAGRGVAGPTLVVLNTVERAVTVKGLLDNDKRIKGTDIRLVHSRFRPVEREEFLNVSHPGSLSRPSSERRCGRVEWCYSRVWCGVCRQRPIWCGLSLMWTVILQRWSRPIAPARFPSTGESPHESHLRPEDR